MITRLAALERTPEDLLLICLKEGISIDNPGIQEIMSAGRAMHLLHPFRSMLITIPEDADMDLQVLRINHGAGVCPTEFPGMLAIASESSLLHSLANVYFAYFPPEIPCRRVHDGSGGHGPGR